MRERDYTRDLVLFILALIGFAILCLKGQAQTLGLVVAKHDAFVSYYDTNTGCPALVTYELAQQDFAGSSKVGSRRFKMDTKLPRPRVKDSDYQNTGLVRGHLCSAADRDSRKDLLKETYLTSNLVPMTMVCNSGPWRVVEDACREHAKQGHVLKVARGVLYCSAAAGLTNVIQGQQLTEPSVIRPAVAAKKKSVVICIPDAFFCIAECQGCRYRQSWRVCNTRRDPVEVFCHVSGYHSTTVCDTSQARSTISCTYEKDIRVYQLLGNYLGSWSQEEYETIIR